MLNQVAVAERKATNVVAAVTFDYRGIDTMGEEFILFAAVLGVAILLRAQRDESEQPPDEDAADRQRPRTSNAVRVVGLALVGRSVLFGIYVVAHGHLTPGAGSRVGSSWPPRPARLPVRRVRDPAAGQPGDPDRGGRGGGRGRLSWRSACSGWPPGAAFLENVLPLGQPGTALGRHIPLINLVVGVEVAGGFVLLLSSSWSRPSSSAARGR